MSTILFTWLVQTALASTIILLCGLVAAKLCQQPADGVRVAQWTLAATLAALGLACWPSMSVMSLGLIDAGGAPTARAAVVDETEAPPRVFEQSPQDALVNLEVAGAQSAEPGDHLQRPVEAANAPLSDVQLGSRPIGQRLITVLVVLYLSGSGAMFLAWMAGLVRLRLLRRRARPAPQFVRRALTQVADSNADGVQLLVSDELAAPIMWGVRRPTIILPTACCDDPSRLRYCLAHEWSHVVRRDAATWQLAIALQSVLYYHPLFWRFRRQLAVSMDQLADAAAAGAGGSATDYAAYLLELARRRLATAPAMSLGMSDKGSRLQERIVMLLDNGLPLRAHCPYGRSLGIAATAIVVAVAAAAVRVDAEQADAPTEPPAAAQPETPAETPPDLPAAEPADASNAPTQQADGSITYFGVVTDKVSGLPIRGVKVSVIRRNSRDDWKIYETTEHVTNLLGVYSFTIPPEQAAEPALYLEVEAHHPNYAALGRGGYSYAMIVKNIKMGELPWFTKLGLWPGDAVTGTVISPDGAPLTGVEIRMYSAATEAEGFPRGSFDKTTTDQQGRFRVVPPTPGDGVLWIIPEDYSPVAYRLRDRRGDWGTLEMHRGVTIPGRVLDVEGEPVAGVRIEARRRGDGEEADEFLNSNSVANGIGRKAISDANGAFTLASLPDGEYELHVQSNSESYDPPPLEQVFLRQSLTIANGAGPRSMEIRAVPHVVISATYLDSQGKPRSGHEVTLFGRWDGGFYAEHSSVPGADGKLYVNAPHGLQQAELDLMTNEHSALRWRLKPGEPLRRGRRVELGTLEDDVSGIEIVRYVAPILLVKPVDEQGRIISDCQPVVTYTRPEGDGEEMSEYTTGGHVSFEHQRDGRWRSSQLLPDEPMKVAVEKAGYECEPQELSLAEGDEHELEIVLKQAAAASP